MDAYTTGLLAVVALSMVAITVPTAKLTLQFLRIVSLQIGKKARHHPLQKRALRCVSKTRGRRINK
jgi:uncharacterized membrane protein